jgi:Protein of unknown function (DUF2992)
LQLTVFYEQPFWVGVLERNDERGYSVSRVVFGSEPRDREVWEQLLMNLRELKFSAPLPDAPVSAPSTKNPKRLQREARAALDRPPLSTKAEDALRVALEQRKKASKKESRAQKESREERQFLLKQEKRKKKKKGH